MNSPSNAGSGESVGSAGLAFCTATRNLQEGLRCIGYDNEATDHFSAPTRGYCRFLGPFGVWGLGGSPKHRETWPSGLWDLHRRFHHKPMRRDSGLTKARLL